MCPVQHLSRTPSPTPRSVSHCLSRCESGGSTVEHEIRLTPTPKHRNSGKTCKCDVTAQRGNGSRYCGEYSDIVKDSANQINRTGYRFRRRIHFSHICWGKKPI
ncbi:unnamed protein product [Onchocerca flexuosa]|uniref:Uncharacterized protein n=1 Tax=Onchocerca flexuosa TaxID=387005 RepID=A0A183I728_9BILA|nr:unnamed protein product [Onchocerca flexuosa]